MLKKQTLFFIFLFTVFSFWSAAQKPVLLFEKDSVQVGEPVRAFFHYAHKSDEEIVFPDSTFNFSPFEFIRKDFFPTKTINGISRDSAVYTLALFEVEGTHALSLPVIQYAGKDTIKIPSEADSVTISPLIPVVSDTLKLKSDTNHIPLQSDFNYLIIVIGIVLLAALALIVYLLFGKRILKLIRKYREKIAHRLFVSSYTSLTSNLNSTAKMEEAVSLWKKYIERLEHKPYTTFTSAEIAANLKNESIRRNLQNIDVAVYGGRPTETASADFEVLLQVANQIYVRNITNS